MSTPENVRPAGGTYADFLAAYHSALGRKASAAIAARRRAGGWTGPAPLGYRNVRKGGLPAVEIDPALGPLVREAFYLAARRDSSLRKVVAELEPRGLVSRNGRPLTPGALRHVLRNPFYLGLVRAGDRLVPGRHPALVGPSVFERAGRALRKRRSRGLVI